MPTIQRSSFSSLIAVFTLSLCAASPGEAAYSATLVGTTATFTGDAAGDTIVFEQVAGFLRHNRFSAGDAGFESALDFDSTVPGVQELAAAGTSTIAVNAGGGDDTVVTGTGGSPAAWVTGRFIIDGAGGIDRVVWDDSADATGRIVNVQGDIFQQVSMTGIGASVNHGTTVEILSVLTSAAADFINVTSTSPAARSINAGSGGDVIAFGVGASLNGGTLDGGADADTIDYASYTTPVAVNLGSTASGLAATLGADQAVPPNSTTATGTAAVTYNATLRTLDVVVAVVGIGAADVTALDLHTAPFGLNGPVTLDFLTLQSLTPTPTGFSFSRSGVAVPAAAEAPLLGGLMYLSVHTAAFPDGVIRGQVFPNTAFTAAPGSATGTGGISNIENATGGSAADRLVGSLQNNVIQGNGDHDIIVASRGNDDVRGGPDDDVMAWSNGDGTDLMEGGTGNDLVQVNGALDGDDLFTIGVAGTRIDFDRISPDPFSLDVGTVENLTALGIDGNDQIEVGNLTGLLGLSTLRLAGLSGLDTISARFQLAGVVANVLISGGTGNDSLTGSQGADVLLGGPDENVIDGSGSIDNVDGGSGNDTLRGGDGNDTVRGGAGNDILVWQPGDDNDVMDGDAGTDTVTFNGSVIAELISIGPQLGRARLTRDVASVVLDIGTSETIQVLAMGGDDVFNVIPLVATTIDINGGVHTIADTLNFNGQNLIVTEAAGTLTVVGRQPVVHAAIETVNRLNPPPTLAITGSGVVAEGNTGSTPLAFTLSLSALSSQPVTVQVMTVNASAVSGTDYTAVNQVLTFMPGVTSLTVQVPVTGDTTFEPNENFVVQLTNPVNTLLGNSQGTATITNDDQVPTISVNDAAIVEGQTGTTLLTFTVALTPASGVVASVTFATADGTATSTDYVPANGVLTFNPGETSKTVGLTINGDLAIEGNETLVLNLSGPTNATLADPQGVGTITNDDSMARITITDAAAAEGNAGTSALAFTVSLSGPSLQTVTVQASTLNGSATAGPDYTAVLTQVLTFSPGVTSLPLQVPVIGDATFEPDETVVVALTNPVNASIDDGQGTGTIANDDQAPTISVDDAVIVEGTTQLTFTVALTPASGVAASVNFATADGTATTADYAPASGVLTFGPGETSKAVTVTLIGDTAVEGSETFVLNLSAPANATVADPQGVGTITDDDSTPSITIRITDAAAAEGNTGTSALAFTVSLSGPSLQTVTVQASTLNASATAGPDYTAVLNQVLTFSPGVTSLPLQIPVIGDAMFEPDETVVVALTNPVNASLDDGQGTGTIANDDQLPAISVNDAAIVEGQAGTTLLTFTVSLTPASGVAASVNFATADGTATTADYVPASGVLTFDPGETSKAVAVTLIGDTAVEGSETFVLNLSAPANATLADPQGVGTLTEDDVTGLITITDPAAASVVATSPFLTIRGTASDDTGGGAVTWSNDRGGAGTAQGTATWVIRNIPLQAGVNAITVTRASSSATLTVTVNEFLYYLAEGATGSFFDLDILIANPGAAAAPAVVTFLKEDGSTINHDVTIPAQARLTIPVETIAGLETGAVSTVVRSTEAKPLVVERSMFWDGESYGSHAGNAVDGAKTRWLFAEGSQGFFDTFVLLANANSTAAQVTLTFLTEFEGPVVVQRTVAPSARLTVWALEEPRLSGRSFSIVVESDQPIIAERAMYFPSAAFQDPSGRRVFEGGHEAAGVSEPATSWFHAEGATGAFFDTFVLVGNPNTVPATVLFTWLLDTGETVEKTKTVPANSRLTVSVEDEDPRLANAALSTTVASDVPVISERAMYWPGTFAQWFEAHDSFGVTEVGTKWGLAEGRVGGQAMFETFILLANAGTTAADVTVTYLRENGSTLVRQYTVGPTSRFSIWANAIGPELANERFGAIIEVTNGVPIAVERAMYNSSAGVLFAGGSNATATRIP